MDKATLDKVSIVVNPKAGTVSDALVRQVLNECRRWWSQVDTEIDPAAAAIVVVGGDGTAARVVAGCAGMVSAPPVMLIPAGTANSYYRTLWGDLPWQDALSSVAKQPAASRLRVDLARLQHHGLVLAGACAGFPPQAIHEAKLLTGLSGRSRYETALRALIARFEPYPGKVTVDGSVIYEGPTLLANAGHSRYRGGDFKLLPHSILDDGLIDVCVMAGELSPGEAMAFTRDGGHIGRQGVVYARGHQVTWERTDGKPLWFEHDGEVLLNASSSFTLEIVPAAATLMAGPEAQS